MMQDRLKALENSQRPKARNKKAYSPILRSEGDKTRLFETLSP